VRGAATSSEEGRDGGEAGQTTRLHEEAREAASKRNAPRRNIVGACRPRSPRCPRHNAKPAASQHAANSLTAVISNAIACWSRPAEERHICRVSACLAWRSLLRCCRGRADAARRRAYPAGARCSHAMRRQGAAAIRLRRRSMALRSICAASEAIRGAETAMWQLLVRWLSSRRQVAPQRCANAEAAACVAIGSARDRPGAMR
jgi:hypothetical protein